MLATLLQLRGRKVVATLPPSSGKPHETIVSGIFRAEINLFGDFEVFIETSTNEGTSTYTLCTMPTDSSEEKITEVLKTILLHFKVEIVP